MKKYLILVLILFISRILFCMEDGDFTKHQAQIPEKSFSTVESLQAKCAKIILKHSHHFLNAEIEQKIPSEVINKIRNTWYENLSKKNDLWYTKLVYANLSPSKRLNNIEPMKTEVNEDYTLIKTKEFFPEYFCYPETKIYNFNGKLVKRGSETRKIKFIPSKKRNIVLNIDELKNFIRSWDNVSDDSGLKNNNSKIIVLHDISGNIDTRIYDVLLCQQFKGYLKNQIALPQIAVLELLRKSYEQNKKITLSQEEKKIIEPIPLGSRKFLKKSVKFSLGDIFKKK